MEKIDLMLRNYFTIALQNLLRNNQWLQDFAYRADISWWIFGSAGAIAILIAAVTVNSQALKAALTNPVDSLRSE